MSRQMSAPTVCWLMILIDESLVSKTCVWLLKVYQCLWTPSKQVARQESALGSKMKMTSRPAIYPLEVLCSNDNTFLIASYHL
jgi:hypothetical protein